MFEKKEIKRERNKSKQESKSIEKISLFNNVVDSWAQKQQKIKIPFSKIPDVFRYSPENSL